MTRRLVLSYLAVTVVVLLLLEVPLAVFYAQRERDRLTAEVERDANVIATIYEDTLEAGRTPDPRPAEQYEVRTGARVVIVDGEGISVVDTDQAIGRDFSTRPEMATALTGARASGTRYSDTLGTGLLYVAVPIASSGVVHGALRVTLDTASVDTRVHRFWAGLAASAAIVLATMALVGWAIARSVTRPIRRLNDTAAQFARGDLTVPATAPGGPPEIRALADTMATMATRLAALIDEQRVFVADASHQLRTPLTALRLRLENLQTRLGDADAAELDTAIDETSRLATLVTDLLQLARADQHPPVADTDLTRICTERVDIWGAVAETHDVHLVLAGADRPVMVRAVPGAIEQILDNTLDNALAVAPAGSSVTIEIDGEADATGVSHRLTVSDQGRGLSDDDKERATRRFWRGSPATAGTGLGLAIAEALAIASGGSIRLSDAPGGGLAVTVTLRSADTDARPAATART